MPGVDSQLLSHVLSATPKLVNRMMRVQCTKDGEEQEAMAFTLDFLLVYLSLIICYF